MQLLGVGPLAALPPPLPLWPPPPPPSGFPSLGLAASPLAEGTEGMGAAAAAAACTEAHN